MCRLPFWLLNELRFLGGIHLRSNMSRRVALDQKGAVNANWTRMLRDTHKQLKLTFATQTAQRGSCSDTRSVSAMPSMILADPVILAIRTSYGQ